MDNYRVKKQISILIQYEINKKNVYKHLKKKSICSIIRCNLSIILTQYIIYGNISY